MAEYLNEWLDGHAMEIKPSTREGYREWLARYVYPRIGPMRLQAVRSASLTTLYRDLSESGNQKGGPLSARSVDYVHAILRKAFNDAVRSDNVLPSNPCLTAKRPRREAGAPLGTVWDAGQLRTFLGVAEGHRLFAFFRLSAYSARGGASCCSCDGLTSIGRPPRFAFGERLVSSLASGWRAAPRAAGNGSCHSILRR